MGDEPRRVALAAGEMLSLMEEVFRAGGDFTFAPLGRSMLPMLRERRDLVVLRSPAGREIKRGDVILYRRAEDMGEEGGSPGERLVLHRVIGFSSDGGMLLCGDAQVLPEKGIRREQVLGVLVEFVRRGKRISVSSGGYRAYAAFWVAIRPLRRAFRAVRQGFVRLFAGFFRKREKF